MEIGVTIAIKGYDAVCEMNFDTFLEEKFDKERRWRENCGQLFCPGQVK